MNEEQVRQALAIREDARKEMERVVSSVQDSLDFTPPESRYEPHLSRMASRCVQIGIDMTRRLHALGVQDGDS